MLFYVGRAANNKANLRQFACTATALACTNTNQSNPSRVINQSHRMPNKKKGKKKAAKSMAAASKGISTTAPESAKRVDDVSHLLFGTSDDGNLPFDLPFIGPVTLIDQRHSDNEHQVLHGRGLVVTRDVSPGECLFAIPAIVSTPVDEVHRRFLELHNDGIGNNETGRSYGKELEDLAESVLIEQIQSLSKDGGGDEEFKQRTSNSFVSQMSSEDVPQTDLDVILGESASPTDNQVNVELDNESILNIIRRNAFGPDYHSYDTIADYWLKNPNQTEYAYKRLLGVYPLAAMINHSCCPSAVRIFGNLPASTKTEKLRGKEVMIVHANKAMKKGTEITWSYLPPTTPFKTRHEILKTKYGFSCQCVRCTSESNTINGIDLLEQLTETNLDVTSSLPNTIQSIESTFKSNSIKSETQRYLRVSHAPLYMQHFNTTLSSPSIKSTTNNDAISSLLKLASQLHFSFVSCNNASTEHISILHLCYELASLLHTRAMSYHPDSATQQQTMSQVRFWTEQLKQAHMVRYGSLGENLESVRDVMKHSRVVLRNRDGWYVVKNRFI